MVAVIVGVEEVAEATVEVVAQMAFKAFRSGKIIFVNCAFQGGVEENQRNCVAALLRMKIAIVLANA